MVEAAMIFPLITAGVAAVLYIVIGMYQSVYIQSSLHLAVRTECGMSTQTVYRMEKIKSYPLEKDWVGTRPVIRMEKAREYEIGSFFKGRIVRKESCRAYPIDEPELIRIFSLLEGKPK